MFIVFDDDKLALVPIGNGTKEIEQWIGESRQSNKGFLSSPCPG